MLNAIFPFESFLGCRCGIWLLFAVSFFTNINGAKAGNEKRDFLKPEIVHPRFLDAPVPSFGIEVRSNPPVLRWPVTKGKNVKYDVKLSKSADFVPGENYLEFNGIPWAIANPHQKLDLGTWYWKYRKSGGKWSEILSFNIGENAVPIVSPASDLFLNALPASHPRVLATSGELPGLRSAEMNKDIAALFREAEASLKFVPPSEEYGIAKKEGEDEEQTRKFQLDASKRLGSLVYSNTLPLCQAYILSGRTEFAEKAIEIAMAVSDWEPRGISSLNDFGDARCMLTMALVYDTFFDKLSEKQKLKLLQSIKPRAEHFYNEWVNQLESKVLSGHVWQHILHYFFQTAIAVYNEEPNAGDWLEYAYVLFLARTPVLGGFDGGWVEGVSYFRMNMETVIDIPLTIKKFTGFDFINVHPWYRESIKWMAHHIPPGSAADGFGDNTEEVLLPGKAYIEYATELAKLTGSPLAAWYVTECRKYENPELSKSGAFRWTRITKTGNIPMPESSEINLPMGTVFRDVGLSALHSNITDTPNNLMVAFKSSPFGSYGHMLCDQNTFNILYGGEKVFYRTGYKVTMNDPHRTGWYRTTKSQNGILIDGEGQPYSNGSYGFISRFVQGEKLAYVKGDATNAYKEGSLAVKGIKKVVRHLVLLKPDIIIIYDELEAEKEVNWSWLIHSFEKMEIDSVAGFFSVELKKTKGQGRFYSSQEMNWALTDTFEIPAHNWRGSKNADGSLKAYDDPQFHLKLTNRKKSRTIRFLTILQVSPSANLFHTLNGNIPDKNGVVNIQLDDWNISANLNNENSPRLDIKEQNGETVFSLFFEELLFNGKKIVAAKEESSVLIELKNENLKVQEISDDYPYDMWQKLVISD